MGTAGKVEEACFPDDGGNGLRHDFRAQLSRIHTHPLN